MKIVIATGGTGGHIFPALQTACVLRTRGHEVLFVGVLGLGEAKIKSLGFRANIIQAKGLTNRSLSGLFSFGSLMLQAVGQSKEILKREKPDKVIGFGGYGSFATVLSARMLHIPVMIHEQNVFPGKANRFLAKFVKKIAISFPEANKHLNSQKTILTGCPSHQQLPKESKEVLLKKWSLDPARKTIVILGGSQGSQKINEAVFEMVCNWQGIPIQVIHMTGKKDYPVYAEKYANSYVPVQVFEFISSIEEVYAIADVAVARAGAATIAELGYFVTPSVLIPYPLADGHQFYNAKVLADLGLAQIIEQKDLTAEGLKRAVEALFNSPSRNAAQIKSHVSFNGLAAETLASAVESL